MTKAAEMYLALGFQEIPPYRYNPVPGTRYMALSLGPGITKEFSSGRPGNS